MRKKFKRGTRRNWEITTKQWKIMAAVVILIFAAVIGYAIAKKQVSEEKIARAIVKSEVTASPTPTVSPTPAPTEEPPRYKTVIKERLIAKHTIPNPNSPAGRNHNLANLAKMINEYTGGKDGYVLLPGEKFDYFEIVGGETKEEDGFVDAGMIIHGRPSTGIGGGVCQEVSTIYSAVWKTKLKKGKKYLHAEKHSVEDISYIIPERGDKEATVAFASKKNFWFVNTLPNPIRLYIKAKGGMVTSEIYERIKKRIEV